MRQICIYSFLLIGLVSCKLLHNETNLIAKEFPRFGIKVSVPDNMNYVDVSNKNINSLFNLYYKDKKLKSPYNTASIDLSYDITNNQIPNDSLFNLFKKIIKTQAENQVTTNYSLEKIQGLPTLSLQFNQSLNNLKMTCINTLFIEQNIIYRLSLCALTDKFDIYSKLYNKIASSIQIGKLDSSLLIKSNGFKKLETHYTNTKYGFEIDIPKGWYYMNDVGGNVVAFKKPNQDTSEIFSTGLNIVDGYDKNMSGYEHNIDVIGSMRKFLLNAIKDEYIPTIKFPQSEYNAYKAYFTAIFNNKKQIIYLYTTIINGKGYIFTGITDEEHRSANEKQFDDIFKTLKINN